jgi:polysaccharide export outer membrane protein
MSNYSIREFLKAGCVAAPKLGSLLKGVGLTALATVLLMLAAGCQTEKAKATNSKTAKSKTTSSKAPDSKATLEDKKAMTEAQHMPATAPANNDTLVLHEGDTVSVTFAGAPDLNTLAVIRRDGRLTLKSFGEFKAAGLTPPEMEKELIRLYGSQLQTKEVSVAVQSSVFPVYVTGAVLRPGKILSDRPITALEAIMEAGGFDYGKANLKSIRVLRTQDGHTQHYTLNLKKVLEGDEPEQFALKPADIIYVPEKFNWF